jgi:thymidylate synthase
MNNIDKQYQNLLQSILDYGVEKKDRTGTGTKSIFGYTIRHNMKDGFPLLTTKKMPFKTIATELIWFLRGDTNIKFLIDNSCHIWDGDAYKNYLIEDAKILPNMSKEKRTELGYRLTQEEFINRIKTDDEFAKKWGELGPVYGKQWRSWEGIEIKYDEFGKNHYEVKTKLVDQIANLISELKTNPDSRRLMVNAWNVGELDQMVLPPCHYGFQVYTRELSHDERFEIYKKVCGRDLQPHISGINFKQFHFDEYSVPKRAISLMWNQRSVDTFLGLPFNIASYGLLLEIIAKAVNMVPDQLIGNLGDTHLYLNHLDQAQEQIGRELTDEERYNIWFTNNYETGMERYFDPNNLPDFDNEYYTPTPKRTREPFELPKLVINKTTSFWDSFDVSLFGHLDSNDFTLENYQSHPTIKAPLSN